MPFYRRISPQRWNGIRATLDHRTAAIDLLGRGSAVSVLDASQPRSLDLFAVSFALQMQSPGPVSYVTITEPMLARQGVVAVQTPGALPVPAANALHFDISMTLDQAIALVQDILFFSPARDGYDRFSARDLKQLAAGLVANGSLSRNDPNHWLWVP